MQANGDHQPSLMSQVLDDLEKDTDDLTLALADSNLKTNVMTIGAIMYAGEPSSILRQFYNSITLFCCYATVY